MLRALFVGTCVVLTHALILLWFMFDQPRFSHLPSVDSAVVMIDLSANENSFPVQTTKPAREPRPQKPVIERPLAKPAKKALPVQSRAVQPLPVSEGVESSPTNSAMKANPPQEAPGSSEPTVAQKTLKEGEDLASVPVSQPRFDAAYLNNPAPRYPPEARRSGEQGKVMLRVLVQADGLPANVEIKASSGSDLLDRAATQAVSRWKFVPAARGGQPLAAWVIVPIVFSLTGV